MRIFELQAALRNVIRGLPEEHQREISALADALEPHNAVSVSALRKKLSTIALRDPKPKATTKPRTSTPRPRPTKAQIAEATEKYIRGIQSSFYDDDAFRILITQIGKDAHVTKDAAINLFTRFFGEFVFDKKTSKKPFIVKQISEHRNTQALREGRTDAIPGA